MNDKNKALIYPFPSFSRRKFLLLLNHINNALYYHGKQVNDIQHVKSKKRVI